MMQWSIIGLKYMTIESDVVVIMNYSTEMQNCNNNNNIVK